MKMVCDISRRLDHKQRCPVKLEVLKTKITQRQTLRLHIDFIKVNVDAV